MNHQQGDQLSSNISDEELEAMYKEHLPECHCAALRAIYDAGIIEGLSRVSNATP